MAQTISTIIPASFWWTLLGGAIGAALTFAVNGFLTWWFGPSLTISVGSTEPYIIVTPFYAKNDLTLPPGKATWIRLQVSNNGADAVGARAFLTDIQREGENKPILIHEALPLWASANGDDGWNKPIIIPRQFRRYFDIGVITPEQSDINIQSDMLRFRIFDKITPGTYIVGIAISGSNFRPVTGRIQIKYDGDPAKLAVSLIQ